MSAFNVIAVNENQSALTVNESHRFVVSKPGAKNLKTVSLALMISHGPKTVREMAGHEVLKAQFTRGEFLPFARDLVEEMVSKSALPYIQPMLAVDPENGRYSKARFIELCNTVCCAVEASGKALKGKKSYLYEVARRVAGAGADAKMGEVIAA